MLRTGGQTNRKVTYRRLKLLGMSDWWHASALLRSDALRTNRQTDEQNHCKSQIVTSKGKQFFVSFNTTSYNLNAIFNAYEIRWFKLKSFTHTSVHLYVIWNITGDFLFVSYFAQRRRQRQRLSYTTEIIDLHVTDIASQTNWQMRRTTDVTDRRIYSGWAKSNSVA